jgi:8-oxo-dGTP pyrophosphatase MutT (NUDIX family)
VLTQSPQWSELLAFIPGEQPLVPQEDAHVPLTFTVVIVRHQGRILFIYNPERAQWENPGGGIEPGEAVDACAHRELMEESSQVAARLEYRGLFKLRFMRDGSMEYGALYTGELDTLRPFVANAEADQMVLCDTPDELPGTVSWLSLMLLNYC